MLRRGELVKSQVCFGQGFQKASKKLSAIVPYIVPIKFGVQAHSFSYLDVLPTSGGEMMVQVVSYMNPICDNLIERFQGD